MLARDQRTMKGIAFLKNMQLAMVFSVCEKDNPTNLSSDFLFFLSLPGFHHWKSIVFSLHFVLRSGGGGPQFPQIGQNS